MEKDIRKNTPAFIPCGDSMEKMEEISDEQLGAVSGGKLLEIPMEWGNALPEEQLSLEPVYEHLETTNE